MNNIKTYTAESVRKGHPDKFCDILADRILDAHLAKDPHARVAVEAIVCRGKLLIAGEVTSHADVDYRKIALETISDVGYSVTDIADEDTRFDIEIRVHPQSPDIANAVNRDAVNIGAGDQGIVVGCATDETPERLPLPVVLARKLCIAADNYAKVMPWLGPDGKAQVSVKYDGDKPVGIDCIVMSLQHSPGVEYDYMRDKIMAHIIVPNMPDALFSSNTKVLVNPSGRFVSGGPAADTGLTGRKLAVDQYGPFSRSGGGSYSGKDPTKVDRSGAYYARYIAVNVVTSGLAKRCEVQLAYAIGKAKPVGITVSSFGTSRFSDHALAEIVKRVFDPRPAVIIRQLDLLRPIYASLASYGHFGRIGLHLPWETADKTNSLIEAAGDVWMEDNE